MQWVMGKQPPVTFDQYRATRQFSALDGLRAVAIFLVFSLHFGGETWGHLSGWLGVQMFFVLSGYLITTLLLRERDLSGSIALRAFYIRRAFRILPMFLLVYVMVMGQSYLAADDSWANMKAASPYYLTFLNEFAPFAPLKMTWTLGIEWKFYFLWPAILAAAGMVARTRFILVIACISVLALSWFKGFHVDWIQPFQYQVMLFGCAAAVILNYRKTYDLVRVLATNTAVFSLVTVLCIVHWKSIWIAEKIGLAQLIVAYGLLIALLIPALVSETIAQTVIGSRPFVFVGRRSYSMYLIELLAAQAVQGLLPQIHFGPLFLPVCFIVALVASDCLYRWIENR
ncbi:acyltransferase [Caballeronia sp. dw_276]|uniref:acyltransferase family protein n=1 Tax=Caballeronia sp. dw_276 TaxID=2719795 RepID=UPI001BD20993|nr:acyltransferase [Caballeronia sp. dw_276]